ncbi:hypothetical protein BC834DRAFT_281155 [Gloeopeniophorella convolvens]|nr:hypothetical protein BC834DRAFT_281155 [Gloeopeniophorella convolvens]
MILDFPVPPSPWICMSSCGFSLSLSDAHGSSPSEASGWMKCCTDPALPILDNNMDMLSPVSPPHHHLSLRRYAPLEWLVGLMQDNCGGCPSVANMPCVSATANASLVYASSQQSFTAICNNADPSPESIMASSSTPCVHVLPIASTSCSSPGLGTADPATLLSPPFSSATFLHSW